MPNSLVKFVNQKEGTSVEGRGDLHWKRADIDGLPFRGHQVPSYRNDEFDERVVRVSDARNGTFYTGDTEENAKYLKVMDAIQNGWYQLVFCERWRQELDSGKQDKFHTIYLEWAEFFLEDGSSTPSVDIKAGFTGM
jgi:hypothetical protein